MTEIGKYGKPMAVGYGIKIDEERSIALFRIETGFQIDFTNYTRRTSINLTREALDALVQLYTNLPEGPDPTDTMWMYLVDYIESATKEDA